MAGKQFENSSRQVPEGSQQVNFNIDKGTLYKVKYIVLNSEDILSNSDLYNKAIQEFIATWERKNGKIKPPVRK